MAIIIPKSVSFAALLRLAIQAGHAGGQRRDAGPRAGSPLEPHGQTPRLGKPSFEQRICYRTFEAGEEILAANDTGGDVYFVLDGEALAIDPGPEDAETGRGAPKGAAAFGEPAAGTGHARKTRFIAARTTHVAVFPHADMTDLINADPSFASWLKMQMTDRLDEPS